MGASTLGCEEYKEALVSVIIPVYNAENFLSETLDSCLFQTHKTLEIICVDNNSSDKSAEILDQYQRKYPEKIRIFFENQAGAPYARNRGIRESKGEFICFLDADDSLLPSSIETLLDHMEDGFDGTCGGEYYFYSDLKGPPAFQRSRIENEDYQIGDILYDSPNTGAVLLRSAIIRKASWDTSLKSEQEIVFWTQLCLENKARFKFIKEAVCKIRIHDSPTRISNQGKRKKAFNKYVAILKIEALLSGSPFTSSYGEIAFNDLKMNHAFNSINARNFWVSELTSARVNNKLLPKSKHFKKVSREGITYITNHYFGFLFHYVCYKFLGRNGF